MIQGTLFLYLKIGKICGSSRFSFSRGKMPRRASEGSGAANAAYLYDPSRENEIQPSPQAWLYFKIKIFFR